MFQGKGLRRPFPMPQAGIAEWNKARDFASPGSVVQATVAGSSPATGFISQKLANSPGLMGRYYINRICGVQYGGWIGFPGGDSISPCLGETLVTGRPLHQRRGWNPCALGVYHIWC